jgi:hypothetical protein
MIGLVLGFLVKIRWGIWSTEVYNERESTKGIRNQLGFVSAK